MAKHPNEAPEPTQTLVFELNSPSLDYSFSVPLGREETNLRFWESNVLNVPGTCVFPQRHAGRKAKIMLIATRALSIAEAGLYRALPHVGSVEIASGRYEVALPLPPDACWHLGSAISDGRARYLLVHGDRASRRWFNVNIVKFRGTDYDPSREAEG